MIKIKKLDEEVIDYINQKDKIIKISCEPSMIFNYYNEALDVYLDSYETNKKDKLNFLLNKIKINWKYNFLKKIDQLNIMQNFILFIGWILTFYIILTEYSRNIYLILLPLSFSLFLSFLNFSYISYLNLCIENAFNLLEKFHLDLEVKIKTMLLNNKK